MLWQTTHNAGVRRPDIGVPPIGATSGRGFVKATPPIEAIGGRTRRAPAAYP